MSAPAEQDTPWWEQDLTPGIRGAATQRHLERARRANERRIRREQAREENAALARLSRKERRLVAREAAQRERDAQRCVRAYRAALAANERRQRRADELRWTDRLVRMLGPRVPMLCERPAHESTTANVQSIFPFYNEEGLGHRGVLIGLNVTGGGAFSFDPWNLYSRTSRTEQPSGRRLVTNGNILIIGAPGQGKSSLLKTYCYRQAAFGRRAEFIDPRGEYREVVEALGGVVVALRPGGDQSLNPLTDVGDPVGRSNLLLSLCRILLGRGLEPVEEVGLLAALEQADATVHDREVCLPDVEAALRDPDETMTTALNGSHDFARQQLRDVMLTLRLLRKGPLRGMFDRPTNIPQDTWDRHAISIDLSAIANLSGADDTGVNVPLAATMLCCSAFLGAKAVQRAAAAEAADREVPKTTRVSDEDWRVLAVPGQAEQRQAAFKLQRASGVTQVVVMHRFSDLRSTGDEGSRARRLAEGLLADTDTVVVYRQDESEIDDVCKLLHLTGAEGTVVENLEIGQALWIVGKWRGLIHHLRSGTELALSDTDSGMNSALPHDRQRDPIVALAEG